MQEQEEALSLVFVLWKYTSDFKTEVQREMNEKHISTMSKIFTL